MLSGSLINGATQNDIGKIDSEILDVVGIKLESIQTSRAKPIEK